MPVFGLSLLVLVLVLAGCTPGGDTDEPRQSFDVVLEGGQGY